MTIPTSSLSRDLRLDLIRIVAMLMVIVLHTMLNFTLRPDFFFTPIWWILEPIIALSRTGVVLFFMLSGYLVVHRFQSIQENTQKIIYRLLIPLSFFEALNIAYAWYRFDQSQGIVSFTVTQFSRITDFPSSPLWFLWVLLGLYALNPLWYLLVNKPSRKAVARYLVVLALSFSVLSVFSAFVAGKNEVVFTGYTAWVGFVGCYLYGALVQKNWISYSNLRNNLSLVIGGIVITIIGDYLNAWSGGDASRYLWQGYSGLYLSFPVLATSIGLFNLLLSLNLKRLCKVFPAVKPYLVWLANLSFGIYLVHPFVVTLLSDFLGFHFDNLSINIYLYNVINFTLVFSTSLVLTHLLYVSPIGIFVGKKLNKSSTSS